MIKKRIVIYILLFALPFNFGCSSLSEIPKKSWEEIKGEEYKTDEVFVQTKKGYKYSLIWESVSIKEDSLFGSGSKISGYENIPFEGSFALENIYKIKTDQFNISATIVLVGFTCLMVVGLLLVGSEGMKSAGSGIVF